IFTIADIKALAAATTKTVKTGWVVATTTAMATEAATGNKKTSRMAKAVILVVTWVDTTVAAGAIRIMAMATAMVAATRTSAHGGIKPRMKCPPGSATKRLSAEGNTTG